MSATPTAGIRWQRYMTTGDPADVPEAPCDVAPLDPGTAALTTTNPTDVPSDDGGNDGAEPSALPRETALS